MKKILAVAIVACALLAQPASAAVQPPANAFITFGGLDWAWASPCHSGGASDCGASVVPNGLGWRYATAAEWAVRPAESDFLDAGGNFAGAGGQMRCASAYFASGHSHCDYFNYVDGLPVDTFVSSGPGNGSSVGYE